MTSAVPHTPPSPIQTVKHPLRSRRLRVSRVETLTPLMRRITFDGIELDFPCEEWAPSAHLKVILPDEQTGELTVPEIRDDRPTRPVSSLGARDYTVRAVDLDAGELVLDFVLHEHGPAGRWAMTAAPGDEIAALGPRGSHLYPQDAGSYVVAGDETALPAISRWLELPVPVRAFISVAAESEIQDLDGDITWLVRTQESDRGARLEEALRGLNLADDVFVFIAGEAGAVAPLRRYLTHERGLRREQIDVDGYWRLGEADFDHHAPLQT